MKFRAWKHIVLAVAICISSLVLANACIAAEPEYHFVGQSLFTGASGLYKLGEDFAYMIEKYTDGRVKIDFHQAGELVPAGEVYNAASAGTIDFAEACPCLAKARSYSLQFFCDAVGGQSPAEKMFWYYHAGGQEILRKMFHKHYGLHPLPHLAATAEVWIYSNKEIKTVQDLTNMKMRAAGVRGDVLSKMGASVVVLSDAEIVPAMDRGVIDAFEYASIGPTFPLGFTEVTKYLYYHPYKSTAPLNLWVFNEDKWNSLPEDLKQAIERASEDAYMRSLAHNILNDFKSLHTAVKEHGAQVAELPMEVAKTVDEAAADYYYERAKNDPELKELLDSWAAFKKEYGSIGKWLDYLNMTNHIGLVKGDS